MWMFQAATFQMSSRAFVQTSIIALRHLSPSKHLLGLSQYSCEFSSLIDVPVSVSPGRQ